MTDKVGFDVIEVHPIKDHGDRAEVVRDRDADFFGLFGRVGGELNGIYLPIGEHANRSGAELAKELIDNKKRGLSPQ